MGVLALRPHLVFGQEIPIAQGAAEHSSGRLKIMGMDAIKWM